VFLYKPKSNRMKKWLLCALAGLSWMLVACQSSPETTDESEVAGRPAPQTMPFAVYDNFSALEHVFHYNNDTTYIINFWATWCKPCVEEMPYFERLIQQVQGKKARVILLSLDFKKDVPGKLTRFVEQRRLESQVIALTDHRYDTWIDKVDPSWGGSIPATLIYKGQNRKFVEQQFASFEELEALVKAFE